MQWPIELERWYVWKLRTMTKWMHRNFEILKTVKLCKLVATFVQVIERAHTLLLCLRMLLFLTRKDFLRMCHSALLCSALLYSFESNLDLFTLSLLFALCSSLLSSFLSSPLPSLLFSLTSLLLKFLFVLLSSLFLLFLLSSLLSLLEDRCMV